MPKVSVIIPIYNVEKYLKRSMDSLANQTMKDLEFICIDDCSTDNSLKILKEYETKDSRFKVITSDVNCGTAAAKNKGLKVAIGEYIGFIDPDDNIDLNYYEELYKKAKEEDFDVVKCLLKTIELNGDVSLSTLNNKIKQEGKYFFSYEWTSAIYKSSIIFENNISFNEELIRGEDTLFLNNIIFKTKKLGFIDNVFYYYYRRKNSLNYEKVSLENVKSGIIAIDMILDNFNKSNLYSENREDYIKFYAHFLCGFIDTNLYRCEDIKAFSLISQGVIDGYHKCKNIEDLRKVFMFKNIIEFIDKKDTQSLVKYFSKYHSYEDFLFPTTFVEKIFSVKNQYINNIKRKVITVLGIKIKIKLKINTELSIIKKIKRNANNEKANAFLLYDCLIDPNIENIDAYTFFLYLQSINENAYYLICEESALYQKLLASGKTKNIIPINQSIIERPEEFLNIIHKILIKTKYILTSFGELPPVTETLFYEFPQWTYVFIQHGVTYLKESVLKTQYLHPNQYNKILVTSDKEIELFKKYSFPEDCLVKGGFPRWDNLSKMIKNKDNSILFMFTYRQYQKDFSQSLYLKNINNLLNNKNLLEFCSQNNTSLYFAPHHANVHINKTTITANNNYITNIKADNISQYIKKCSCLVTDFSSVSFDFMLQNKPVLYYIPDKDDINLPSQEKFNIEKIEEKRHNLYNFCNTEEELIERLKYYINNDFQLEDNIKENYSSFFAVKNNCCEDLYKKLKKI